ncbi:MAG: peptidoglycan-binding protein [Patescibacteria group bacterium]|nr:peptidoglycan-binding protein [Patescibacteria group bacterium]
MKKQISALALLAMIAPLITFAAGNDVTLDSNAILQVGTYTLNVSGTSPAVQSVTVNDNATLSVTLASGSSITVSSPALYQLLDSTSTDETSNICSNATSSISLSYSGVGTVTNTITPTATSCSTAFAGAPTGVSATAGNGQAAVSFTAPSQGGSPITSYTVTSSPGGITATGSASPITVTGLSNGTSYTFTVTATNQSGVGPVSSASNAVTPTAPSGGGSNNTGGGSTSSGGSVPSTVLTSLLATTTATTTQSIPGCPHNLICTPIPGYVASSTIAQNVTTMVFGRNLTIGSRGSDVIALQNFLIAKGFLNSSYNSGYFGPLTKTALSKYQFANGISPASGYFGPVTRKMLNGTSLNVQAQIQNQNSNVQANTSSKTFTRNLTIGSRGSDVTELQNILITQGLLGASYNTGYFGSLTQTALAKYQADNDISPSSGYFGPKTRAVMSK